MIGERKFVFWLMVLRLIRFGDRGTNIMCFQGVTLQGSAPSETVGTQAASRWCKLCFDFRKLNDYLNYLCEWGEFQTIFIHQTQPDN